MQQTELMNETGFAPGDICLYSFDDVKNNTALIVRIKELLSEKAAKVDIVSVLIDDSGNGIYEYLENKGYDTNVSLCYLKKLQQRLQKSFLKLKLLINWRNYKMARSEYSGIPYLERLRIYESKKKEIERTSVDYLDYERKIRALIIELGI